MNRRGLLGFIWHPLLRLAILIIGVAFIIAWIVTLVNVKTSELTVTNVTGISVSGLTVNAQLTVENSGMMPVAIESIPYSITLDGINGTLASGTAEGFTLPAGKSKEIPLAMKIAWAGASKEIVLAATKDTIPATITTEVRVQPIYVLTIPVTVKRHVDLANYTNQASKPLIDKVLDTAINGDGKEVLGSLLG